MNEREIDEGGTFLTPEKERKKEDVAKDISEEVFRKTFVLHKGDAIDMATALDVSVTTVRNWAKKWRIDLIPRNMNRYTDEELRQTWKNHDGNWVMIAQELRVSLPTIQSRYRTLGYDVSVGGSGLTDDLKEKLWEAYTQSGMSIDQCADHPQFQVGYATLSRTLRQKMIDHLETWELDIYARSDLRWLKLREISYGSSVPIHCFLNFDVTSRAHWQARFHMQIPGATVLEWFWEIYVPWIHSESRKLDTGVYDSTFDEAFPLIEIMISRRQMEIQEINSVMQQDGGLFAWLTKLRGVEGDRGWDTKLCKVKGKPVGWWMEEPSEASDD